MQKRVPVFTDTLSYSFTLSNPNVTILFFVLVFFTFMNICLWLVQTFNNDVVLFGIIPKCRMNCFFCK